MIVHIDIGDVASIQAAADQLHAYAASLDAKAKEICERLAAIGATRASLDYARVPLHGFRDVSISVEETDKGYKILASGESVLFLEFGAGKRMGYGHPDPGDFGPGTFPGKGHWDDPHGWWIPKEHGGGHTYGNPPAMGMYNASREIRDMIQQVAEEVLKS